MVDSTNALNTSGSKLFKLPAPPAGRSLYNGNIAASTTLPGYFEPLYTGYRYDKLNRIKTADYIKPAYTSGSPLASAASGPGSLYHSNYAYDLDGNLTALNRYGYNSASQQVYLTDSMYYLYAGGTRNNNRLTNYTDTANHSTGAGAGFTNDIAKYSPPGAASFLRLQYDPTGNLVKDLSNGLTSIDWTLYGKTSKVEKDDGHTLSFTYDPLGNRFSKTVYSYNPGIDSSSSTEYYIREASGNILAIYRQQQHYYYYDPYSFIIAAGTAISAGNLSGALSGAFGGSAPFAAAIVSGTVAAMPTAFVSARVSSRNAGFYARTSSMARSSLAAATPDLSLRLAAYDSTFSARLYPVWAGYNEEPLQPLADGIADTVELSRVATLLFSGADSTAMHARYETYRGGLDSGVYYSAAQLGALLANDILVWRAGIDGHAAAQLRGLLWPLDSTSYSLDSSRTLYQVSLARLTRDSAYLKTPLDAGVDSGAQRPRNLDGKLRLTLADASASLAEGTEIPAGPSGLGRVLAGYLAQRYSGTYNDTAIAMLRSYVGDETLLGAVYADSSTVFINNLLADAGGGSGGGSSTAKGIVANALKMANSGSAAGAGSPAGALSVLAYTNPNLGTYLNTPFATMLDYDRLYLAEHHMYGSSRLGIKKYWPYQYRYEWSKAKTIAQNNAAMDSSDVTYRMPWYYGNWQSLVSANELTAAGHANTQPLYSARIVGQKGYELTNHLGNVMAVVSDKVTDDTLGTATSAPIPVAKRAGLSAAYDHYPFGMLMPHRFVEDNTVNCIPVSKVRYIDQITYVGNAVSTANAYAVWGAGNRSYPFLLPTGTVEEAHAVTMSVFDEHDGGEVASRSQGTSISLYLDLPARAAGVTGVRVAGRFSSDGGGPLTMSVVRVANPNEENSDVEVLSSGTLNLYKEEGELTLDAFDVPDDQYLRLLISYEGTGTPQASGVSARLLIPQIIYSVVTKAAQTYVTLSCDTDGNYAGGYRYGFNGQHKDNEIAGAGNHNTAIFWEYDTRTGRRWNIDPIVKPFLSGYSCFSGNPIWKIDPNGDDDFFSKDGKFIKHTNGGSSIRIMDGKNIQLFSQFLSNKSFSAQQHAQATLGIANYYAPQAGVSGTISLDYYSLYSSPAHTNSATKEVSINAAFSPSNYKMLDNAGNVTSILKHENGHQQEGESESYSYSQHSNVYLNQMLDKSFYQGTTEDFQKSTIASFAQQVMNDYNTTSNPNPYAVFDIVDKFNKGNKGGYTLSVNGALNPQQVSMTLYKKGERTQSEIKYEKKTDAVH